MSLIKACIRPPPLTAGTTGNDPAASDLIGQELHLLAGPSPAVWHGAIQSVSPKPRRQSTPLTLGLRLSFQMSLNVLVTPHQRELFKSAPRWPFLIFRGVTAVFCPRLRLVPAC
jgi:hypothetical protein